MLDPDVAQSFPDSQSVNEALRALIEVAQRTIAKGLKHSLSAKEIMGRNQAREIHK
jgi:hypothetical protein